MVSSDTVVGIVGAVILTGAMIAVFYYENTNADDGGNGDIIGDGAQTYTFTYAQANGTAVNAVTETIQGQGNSADFEFDLPAYVFQIEAKVTWADDDQAPPPIGSEMDTLKVEFFNEAGTLLDDHTAMENDGEIIAHHGHGTDDTNTTPPQRTVIVAGDSEQDARDSLANATADAHGAGGWTVRVTLEDTGGGTAGSQTDTQQAFTITITYRYWDAQPQS